MTWVRIESSYVDHPKIVALGDLAGLGLALHVGMICYCNRFLTDGVIPKCAVRRLVVIPDALAVTPDAIAAQLEAVGVLEDAGAAWRLHDFLIYQPSRADVEAARAALSAERSRAGRAGVAVREANRAARRALELTAGGAQAKQANAKQTGSNPDANREATAEATAKQTACSDPVSVDLSLSDPADAGAGGEPTTATAADYDARHARHAVCGRVCFPAELFAEYLEQLGGVEGRGRLRELIRAHLAEIADLDGPVAGAADPFRYWRRVAELAGWFGRPAPVGAGSAHRPAAGRRGRDDYRAHRAALEASWHAPRWSCHHGANGGEWCRGRPGCYLRTLRDVKAGREDLAAVPEPLRSEIESALEDERATAAAPG